MESSTPHLDLVLFLSFSSFLQLIPWRPTFNFTLTCCVIIVNSFLFRRNSCFLLWSVGVVHRVVHFTQLPPRYLPLTFTGRLWRRAAASQRSHGSVPVISHSAFHLTGRSLKSAGTHRLPRHSVGCERAGTDAAEFSPGLCWRRWVYRRWV